MGMEGEIEKSTPRRWEKEGLGNRAGGLIWDFNVSSDFLGPQVGRVLFLKNSDVQFQNGVWKTNFQVSLTSLTDVFPAQQGMLVTS
jgi:hypothetical protein